MSRHSLKLVWPAREHLPGYVDALGSGWSPNTVRGAVVAREQLAQIGQDADAFLASLVDREAKGPPIELRDGSFVPRLPGYHRWMWDGEFCGSINFRWQPGTAELPPHVLGHIGYTVVPAKRGLGYATRALGLLLAEIGNEGLPYVIVTTDPENLASQRVITANRGLFVERYAEPAQYGSGFGLKFRIDLPQRDG